MSSIEKGMPQRQNSMKRDDDEDGKINEDGYDDLNGDGHITQFRHKDPKGQYVIDDEDPRLMIRLRGEEKTYTSSGITLPIALFEELKNSILELEKALIKRKFLSNT